MDEKLTDHASIRIRRNRWNKNGSGGVLGYIMRNWGNSEPRLKSLRHDRTFYDRIIGGATLDCNQLIICVEGSRSYLFKMDYGCFLVDYEQFMEHRKRKKRIRYCWTNAILKGEGYRIDVR